MRGGDFRKIPENTFLKSFLKFLIKILHYGSGYYFYGNNIYFQNILNLHYSRNIYQKSKLV